MQDAQSCQWHRSTFFHIFHSQKHKNTHLVPPFLRNPTAPTDVMEDIKDDLSVQHLLDGCRQGKRSAQYQLYTHFYNYTMTVARRYTGNLETAEEVVNDAFFKVFIKIDQYVDTLPFRFWLRRIVINTAIDRLRSALNAPTPVELQPWHDPEQDTGIVEALTREQILAMLDNLPPAYRTVFNLFVVDGFSHEEIAEKLQISVGTSKSNLSRARQHLRILLSNDFEFSK